MKKSQASAELLIILSISMIVLLAIVQTSDNSMRTQNRMLETAKTTSFLEQIVSGADLVYQQGYGAKTRKYLAIPKEVKNITLEDKTITLNFYDGNLRYRTFDFEVVGSLPTEEGNYWIHFEAMNGFVIISTNVTEHDEHGPICGNSIIEIGEECDGTNLGGMTCQDFGYDYGTLSCTNCRFDTSGCSDYTVEICDDGVDNTGNGLVDCEDPSCIGQIGPNGGICCAGDDENCPGDDANCKSCGANNECEFMDTTVLCDEEYLCSNAGPNGYGIGGRIPSQGYCDGYGSCTFALNSPSCTVEQGAPYEALDITICADGYAECIDTCADGIDNDGSGCVDGADHKCGGIETSCDDGIDNNCNGLIDCEDPSCADFPGCTSCEHRPNCEICVADGNCHWCQDGLYGSGCMQSGDCRPGGAAWHSCSRGDCYRNSCP